MYRVTGLEIIKLLEVDWSYIFCIN